MIIAHLECVEGGPDRQWPRRGHATRYGLGCPILAPALSRFSALLFFSFLFAASPHLRSATAVERCEHDGEERAGGEGTDILNTT